MTATVSATPSFKTLALGICLFIAAGASAAVPIPDTDNIPYVLTGDPTTRDVPFLHWHEDLSADGYTEEEILISGTGNEYEYVNDAAQDPDVQPSAAAPGAYTSRVLIRRPSNAADFNGVVYMEILNATANYDGAPMWGLTYPSIIADGAAWVGVTYSDTTANFMRSIWGRTNSPVPAGAQPRNRSRYATLNIPSRAYTWDILNQTAALLKADADARNPMQGFGVDTIIATGYSQSARYVTTYANSFYPSYSELDPCTPEKDALDQCTPIVDGYIVAAGGPVSSEPDGVGRNPAGDRRNCENSKNRAAPCIESGVETDSTRYPKLPKIMRFTTESDITAARVRQDCVASAEPYEQCDSSLPVSNYDQPNLRTYEVAGISHVGFWLGITGQRVAEYQFGIPATGDIESACDFPYNPLRTGPPLSAIQHRLARWIKFDELPPPNHFMFWEGDFTQFDDVFRPLVEWVRDDGDTDSYADDPTDRDFGIGDGNAIGGLRPARIEVPLGNYLGSNKFDAALPPFPTDPTDPNYEAERDLYFGVFAAKQSCTGIIGGFDAFSAEELAARYSSRREFLVLTWWLGFVAFIEGSLLPVDGIALLDEARAIIVDEEGPLAGLPAE